MNLAGKRILVCGGRDFTDYPLFRDARRPVSGAGATAKRQSHHSRASHLVPIVDEALLAFQQLGWPKGPRYVERMYNIGQSDTRGWGGDARRLLEPSAGPKIDRLLGARR
jgi:hypothetical protein